MDLLKSCNVVLIVSKLVEVIVECHLGPVAIHVHPVRQSGEEGKDQQVAIGFEVEECKQVLTCQDEESGYCKVR